MDMQALIDGMGAKWQRERAVTQLTLGKLIAALEAMPAGSVTYLCSPHSYRGYYCDLALERCHEPRPSADLLVECKAAMGKVFEGYKGGDFVMGELTPVWLASYGSCGEKLMAVHANGELELEEDE